MINVDGATVSGSDDATLSLLRVLLAAPAAPLLADEIEARATAYLQCRPYHWHDREFDTGRLRVWTGSGQPILCPALLTCDADRKVEYPPDWWLFQVDRYVYSAAKDEGVPMRPVVQSDLFDRPEPAELMCILLAWQFVRDQ